VFEKKSSFCYKRKKSPKVITKRVPRRQKGLQEKGKIGLLGVTIENGNKKGNDFSKHLPKIMANQEPT